MKLKPLLKPNTEKYWNRSCNSCYRRSCENRLFCNCRWTLPNTGAGYVIRRILRRAIRYGFTFLGQKNAFIHLLVATLEQQMGEAFPELKREQKLAFNVIRKEENSFLKTLDQGLLLLDTILKGSDNNVLEGQKPLNSMTPTDFLMINSTHCQWAWLYCRWRRISRFNGTTKNAL